MYCKKCGKEISDDSFYCSHCGTSQLETLQSNHSIYFMLTKIYSHIKEHKVLSYIYIVWFFIHLILLAIGNWDGSTDYFFPFTAEKDYWNERFQSAWNYHMYDISEFISYTCLLPILCYGVYKLYFYINDRKNKQGK